MIKNENKKKHISLTELCRLLEVKGVKTALEWCQKNKVPTKTIANKLVADFFFVQLELDRKIIRHLKVSYPDQWEELYLCYTNNDRNSFIELTENKKTITQSKKPLKRVCPKSKFAKKFAET